MMEMNKVPVEVLANKVEEKVDLSLCFPGSKWIHTPGPARRPAVSVQTLPRRQCNCAAASGLLSCSEAPCRVALLPAACLAALSLAQMCRFPLRGQWSRANHHDGEHPCVDDAGCYCREISRFPPWRGLQQNVLDKRSWQPTIMSFLRKGGRLRVGGYRGTSWNIVTDATRSSLGDETTETIYVCQELICIDMVGQRLAAVEMNSIYCLHLVTSDAE